MSLYGALSAGVSGLRSQGTAIGIISDNIANVNTVGYKANKAYFETLVTNSTSTVSYSPGGVLAANRQIVDKQGLLQSTDAATDIAVSGGGMFVVNSEADASGDILYTRAGSFRQDALGNFVNAAGFFLQGWPLDRDGRLPGEIGNINTTSSADLRSLEVVNVETASGVAAATTTVEIGANLNARQETYAGAGINITMDISNSRNYEIAADDIIIPDQDSAAGLSFTGADLTTNTNFIDIGDQFTAVTDSGLIYTYTYGGLAYTKSITAGVGTSATGAPYTGNIFNASANNQAFFGGIDVAATFNANPEALTFTIDNATAGTVTFTYVTSSPSASQGEFNSLSTLAQAIDDVNGLTARVNTDGRLYVAAENATESITWTNGNTAVIDWVNELSGGGGAGALDVANGANRFNSLQGLYNLVESSEGLRAILSDPLSQSSLQILSEDPLGTISFYDGADGDETTIDNNGSLLAEFGVVDSLDNKNQGAPYANYAAYLAGENGGNAYFDGPLGPAYDSSNSVPDAGNMASGEITPHFSRNIRIYDSLGTGHDMTIGYLKTDINTWAVEIWAADSEEITNSVNPDDGLLAAGTIEFNGDGSLRSVSPDLQDLTVIWSNGAQASEIEFNWGTSGQPFGTVGATQIGLTDGLSQFSADYNVAFINQNGAEVGSLVGVTIDELGFVIASYSNGETQRLFKLPLADFTNPNGLRAISGNVYAQTEAAGEVNLREAKSNGVGEFVPAALELSNVEMAQELTDLIIAQRAYQASSRVISTSDELLEELTRL